MNKFQKYTANIFLWLTLSYFPLILYGESNSEITTVKLQLKWKHQFQFAGYYAAIEKGFYNEVGINVKLIEADKNINLTNAVFENKAEFGVSTSDIFLSRSQLKPAVILASIFQHSPQVIIAAKKSGITHVHDLVGKTIMLETLAADIISYLKDENISHSNINIIEHTYCIRKLLNGETDAITAYLTDEPYLLDSLNFEYTVISPLNGGIDFYGDILYTSETLIKKSPKLVNNFLSASLKGWKYAMNNTEEIVDIIYEKYSKRHSKEHLRFEANKMKHFIMQDVIEIGYSNIGRWNNIIETYKKLGLIDKNTNSDGLLYSHYQKPEIHVPWPIIGITTVVLSILLFIILFYFRLSRKLKIEVNKRKIAQEKLTKREHELRIVNEALSIELKQRKRTEQNLIKFSIAVEQSPTAIAITDTYGNIE